MDADTIQEVCRLKSNGMGKRAIARKIGRNVKTIRRILKKHFKTKDGNAPPQEQEEAGTGVPQERSQSKLAPYYDAISEKVKKGLTGARILREIKEQGYTGGRTILQGHLRKIRPPTKVKKRVFRRFETEPALEAQVDWSPFRVIIGGIEKVVHCFAMILCYSRFLFVQFHRDERLPTLLEAHVDAFEFFRGVTRRVVYDNMSTITFGRKGRDILWNPEFLKFAQHHAYEPVLCRIADPNRKGKIEIVFRLVERDLLRGREFASWDELDRAVHAWLAEIANRRCHGTTRQVPEDMWLMERDFLTALPDVPYPAYREEIRSVYHDGLIIFDGTRYSVPAYGIGNARSVTVRSHPRYIELLNGEGQVIATHKKPDVSGGMVIDPEHYATIRPLSQENAGEAERRFLALFPGSDDFLRGVKKRMKALYRLHLGKIIRLCQAYGQVAVRDTLIHVTTYGNFSAYAVERVLRERFPLAALDFPTEIVGSQDVTACALGEVDPGSFEEYRQYSEDAETDQDPADVDQEPEPKEDV